MKRDWGLIRALLQALENMPTATGSIGPADLPDFGKEEAAYHV